MNKGRDITRAAARLAAALALCMVLAAWGAPPALARVVSYTYDAAGRLTGADYTGGDFTASIAYEYDPAGNRVAETITGTVGPGPTPGGGVAEVIATTLLGQLVPDADGDGMLDAWERQHFGDTSRDGTGDYDSDGLTDLRESQLETDPTKRDTDGDGYSDGDEVEAGTDPTSASSRPGQSAGMPWLPLLLR